MTTDQSSGCRTPMAILTVVIAGASGGGLLAGAVGAALGGVLGVIVGLVVAGSMTQPSRAETVQEAKSSERDRQSETATTEKTESEESLQSIVDDISQIGVEGALGRNKKARNLEREAREERNEGNDKEADVLIEEAKELYRKNVERGFVGTAPYKRLAIIYRREEGYDSEIAISKKALDVADLTEKQREHFEHRIKRAEELRER